MNLVLSETERRVTLAIARPRLSFSHIVLGPSKYFFDSYNLEVHHHSHAFVFELVAVHNIHAAIVLKPNQYVFLISWPTQIKRGKSFTVSSKQQVSIFYVWKISN